MTLLDSGSLDVSEMTSEVLDEVRTSLGVHHLCHERTGLLKVELGDLAQLRSSSAEEDFVVERAVRRLGMVEGKDRALVVRSAALVVECHGAVAFCSWIEGRC